MTWKTITAVQGRGKALAANAFIERPGPTSYAYRYMYIVKDSPISAFHLFFDEPMLISIQKYTTSHGTFDNKSFSIHLDELESFIDLQLIRGVLVDKNTPLR